MGKVEEPADLDSPLGTETLGQNDIGKPGNISISLLDDDEGEDRNIGADDASIDRLALALTGAADAVARVALGEEEMDKVGDEVTLLHWETSHAAATRDTTLPFAAQ